MSDRPDRLPDLDLRLAQREAVEGQRPVMFQRWSELLFLHWTLDPELIQATLPEGLTVDTFGDRAWIGLVPFRMSRIRPRGLPAVPWLSAFPELNVRTYVHDREGRPGVWFYSLDAARWLAVKFAQSAFHLPYHHAEMPVSRDPETDWIDYRCRRFDGQSTASFRYRGAGEVQVAEPGSLEFFLVERYLLFADSPQGVRGGYVAHPPYRFRGAEVEEMGIEPVLAAGFPAPEGEPAHVAYVESVDVSIFSLESPSPGAV